MKKSIYYFLLIAVSLVCKSASASVEDSVRVIGLDGVEVVSSPKESTKMNLLPVSVSTISQKEMDSRNIRSLKGMTDVVPNFYMPDYGSRLTSAIYIRGVGSRINTPAVGLYVDNIPYMEKSAYDFNFFDIERVDILRGPQGTLYGRNTMGGVVKVYTRNPFRYQGTDINLGFATKDNHRTLSLTHYHRISSEFAFSAGGYYEGGDGFFRNDSTGSKVDAISAGGGRIRALWLPTSKMKLDFSANYDYTDQGAYPYYYQNRITNNHENRYRRGLLNLGLNMEYQNRMFTMNSVTGYQNLNDRMFIDQDFIANSLYTLEQKQKSNVVSQEVIFRSPSSSQYRLWEWLTGVSGFYQSMKTNAPVTFENEGIESMIEDNVNSIFRKIKAENPRMPNMGIDILDDEFVVSSDMSTPTLSGALFHQSSFNVGKWRFTAGARLEYENLKLNYLSDCDIDYNFSLTDYHRDFPLNATPLFDGSMKRDYWQFLPKFSVQYLNDGNQLYATIAKGYRSGGYNVQMFSDLIKNEMRNQMIDQIDEVSHGMVPDKDNLKATIDINDVVYEPEYSWNYEVGAKLRCGEFGAQCSMFYIDTRNQQISRFAESGLGRMMLNAGKSRSFGAEVALSIMDCFSISYGYTNARFRDYNDGENDYSDNYVPFIPMHTLNAGLEIPYELKLGSGKENICSFTFGVNYSGVGRIYWTEDNSAYQNFYGLLGAYIGVEVRHIGVNLWAKNLTNRKYDTFYFESMNRGFAQHGKPIQFGIDLRIRL